ncbi:B3 domain-containing protein At1g05920-like [Lycium barbarum]|uniref:B3 domain-containing protein At1g05920-like n=1 Tax=Lycium barbarum TaxID=112863 RepID=UPI00293F7827|nr:B3 domain-containing protein At1g05920-like [Lycium barbarum]
MAFTLLSVDDFLGMEFKSNMSRMDYLLAVSEVAWLKSMSGEEDNLIAEQDEQFRNKKEERITQNIQSILSTFPAVLNRQEKPILDFVIPKAKRSMPKVRPRKVTKQFLCNTGELMIKKAVENNSEEQEHRVKADDERKNSVFKFNWGPGLRDLEFFHRKKFQKHEKKENSLKGPDDRENKVSKLTWRFTANFAFGNPKRRKRSQDVANDVPLGFNNQEQYLLKEKLVGKSGKHEEDVKEEATRQKKKAKRNIIGVAEAPLIINKKQRELPIEFKNVITEIGGSLESLKLVIVKRLFQSDVKRAEGRLSIPLNKITEFLEPGDHFLSPDEDARLDTRNGGKMFTMRVTLIEPSRRISKINLRKWHMNKDNGKRNSSYVLVTDWNEVTKRNALKIGTPVQLWSFRMGPDLCFALVKPQD